MVVMSVAQTQIICSASVNITSASVDLAVVGRVRNLHFYPLKKNVGHQVFVVARWLFSCGESSVVVLQPVGS